MSSGSRVGGVNLLLTVGVPAKSGSVSHLSAPPFDTLTPLRAGETNGETMAKAMSSFPICVRKGGVSFPLRSVGWFASSTHKSLYAEFKDGGGSGRCMCHPKPTRWGPCMLSGCDAAATGDVAFGVWGPRPPCGEFRAKAPTTKKKYICDRFLLTFCYLSLSLSLSLTRLLSGKSSYFFRCRSLLAG